MIGGLRIAVEHPTGLGTGATSIASDRGAGTSNSTTEVDLTNVFISFGIFGGLLFAVLLARVMWTVGREAFGRHEVDAILILAVLVASFGQWLNGGLYALSPLVWLLVGSVVGQVVEREEAEREASTGAAAEPV
jgi:hypothetical protein